MFTTRSIWVCVAKTLPRKCPYHDQDDYALRSYKLSAAAYKDNIIQKELVEVRIPQKKGTDKLISVF